VTYYAIWLLSKAGIVWDVRKPRSSAHRVDEGVYGPVRDGRTICAKAKTSVTTAV
jgi:hypothetical protein